MLQPKLESVFSSNNDSRKSVRNGFAEVKNTDFQEIFELNHPYLRNPDTVYVYGAEDYKNGEDTRVVKDGDTYKMYVYQNGEKVAVELSEAEYEGLAKTTDKYY